MNGTDILTTLHRCLTIQNHWYEIECCIFWQQMLSGMRKIILIPLYLIFSRI